MFIPIGTDERGKVFSFDSAYHVAISGASGMGKSTLLLNIFIDFIRRGGGGILVDVHGDLADQAMSLMPISRRRDVIYADPSADRVMPLNPLAFKDPDQLQLAKESLFLILKAFAGDAWGNETPWVIRNAIDAVCGHFAQPTPVHVFRFLADDGFREAVLDASVNPFLKMFQKQYAKLRNSEQMAKFSPAINKEGKLMHPAILPMIGQPDSIDMLDAMNTSKIIVCRFASGRIGEDAAQILSSMMASTVSIAGMQRERQDDRPPFMNLFDEAGSAAHSGRFKSLLEESRKYGNSLVAGFQGLYQLSFAEAVKTNCSTKIAFNNSGEEAEATAKDWLYEDFPQKLEGKDITKLPRYQFQCRTFVKDRPTVAKIKALGAAKPRMDTIRHAKTYFRSLECDRDSLIRESLQRYSRDKADVIRRIEAELAQPA
jgi:hypothetical protein